jgi:hypothetical protein
MNFPDRKAIIIDTAPDAVSLSGFTFGNVYTRSEFRLEKELKWKNVGNKAITAFEVVTIYYDPFNRQVAGSSGRWQIPGHNSANYTPLQPGESDGDGTTSLFGTEYAYTGVVYVRAVRFADGTVWYAKEADVAQKIKAALPQLTEVGPLVPEAKK